MRANGTAHCPVPIGPEIAGYRRPDLTRLSRGLTTAWRALLLCGILLLPWTPEMAGATSGHAANQQSVRTPPPGTTERREILDALRLRLNRQLDIDLVFLVVELKVQQGWAWVHTRPQSRDGSNHYEDIVALLREEDGTWRVVELDADDGDSIQRRFPNAPAAILPVD